MSAAPLLAALLAGAFPGLAARDLGLPAGRLLPWLPGVGPGPIRRWRRDGAAGALPPERAALCSGFDPIADGMPDAAWDAAAERLVWRDAPAAADDPGLTLLHGGLGEAPLPAGLARIMLLVGSTAQAERMICCCPKPGWPRWSSGCGRGGRPGRAGVAGRRTGGLAAPGEPRRAGVRRGRLRGKARPPAAGCA